MVIAVIYVVDRLIYMTVVYVVDGGYSNITGRFTNIYIVVALMYVVLLGHIRGGYGYIIHVYY
jgi:hypothetical protein